MFKVMFLCTGNSCRSQMAEGLARRYGAGLIEAHSAGLAPAGVNPHAIKAMAELGIDISAQRSKAIDPELLKNMDIIVTLCGHAEALCPRTPAGIRRLHWPIDDPVGATGPESAVMAEFRRARDDISVLIQSLLKELR